MQQRKWRSGHHFENRSKIIRFVGELSQIWPSFPTVIQRTYDHFGDEQPSPKQSFFSNSLTRAYTQTRRVNSSTPLIPGRDEIIARCCLSNAMYGLMDVAKYKIQANDQVWDYTSESYWDWKNSIVSDMEITIKRVPTPVVDDWGWLVKEILSEQDINMIGEDALLIFSGIVM